MVLWRNNGLRAAGSDPRYGLTYTDGDELIELAPPGDEALSDLSRLLLQRMRWRRSNGAVMFDRPEGRFRRSDGALTLQVIDPSPSRLMVSEAMLLMGAVVASFGQEHNLPLPYRSQPAAELPSSDELDRIPEGPARDAAIKRCLSRGIQGTRTHAPISASDWPPMCRRHHRYVVMRISWLTVRSLPSFRLFHP